MAAVSGRSHGVKLQQFDLQCAHAADRTDGKTGQDDHHAHFQHELKKIRDQHAPEPGQG